MSGILEYVFLRVWLFYVNFLHVEVKCVSRKKQKIRLNIFLSNGTCHLDNMVLLTSNDFTSILRAKRISKEIVSGKICGGVRNCFILGGRVEGRDCTPFSYKLNAAINFVKIICRFFHTFNDKSRTRSASLEARVDLSGWTGSELLSEQVRMQYCWHWSRKICDSDSLLSAGAKGNYG